MPQILRRDPARQFNGIKTSPDTREDFLVGFVIRNMINAFVIVFDNKDVAKTSKIKVTRNIVSLLKTKTSQKLNLNLNEIN